MMRNDKQMITVDRIEQITAVSI